MRARSRPPLPRAWARPVNVRCPECGTLYLVDPAKIPSGGVRARCERCPAVIELRAQSAAASPQALLGTAGYSATPAARVGTGERTEGEEQLGTGSGPGLGEEPSGKQEADSSEIPETGSPHHASATVLEEATLHSAPAPEAAPVAENDGESADSTATAGEAAESTTAAAVAADAADSLLNPDPHERARRLARALVSDIATYHGSRRDRGLRDGTLRYELKDEIRRSWDEYVGHIGNQMARETSYFRDALNEILARGQRLF